MKAVLTQSNELIIHLLRTDKNLANLALTDAELRQYKAGDFSFVDVSKDIYLSIFNEVSLIGFMRLQGFTEVTLLAHIYLLFAWQGENLAFTAIDTCFKFIKKNFPSVTNLVSFVPDSCDRVKKNLEKFDHIKRTTVPLGGVFRDKLQDFHIYQLYLGDN